MIVHILIFLLSLPTMAFGAQAAPQPSARSLTKKLFDAALSNDAQAIEEMYKAGTPIDSRGSGGKTALMVAAENGNEEAVNQLILLGANVNAQDKYNSSVISLARFHPPIVDRLLQAGAYIEKHMHKVTAPEIKNVLQPYQDLEKRRLIENMMEAVEEGNLIIIRAVLKHTSVDVNTPDKGGWTMLDWAAFHNKPAVAAYLLSMGANPESATFKRLRDQHPEIRAVYENYLKNARNTEAHTTQESL